jgi:hypothetical protein
MENSQKSEFIKMLTEALASYGKQLPTGDMLTAWWENLQPFPLRAVEIAFQGYLADNGEFAPLPAGIAKRCKLMDGRPNPEEAWAIALQSQDEANTVIWTEEIAQAFSICQTVLDMGDEVGARMAFKETYARIIAEARSAHKMAKWVASLGWDADKRVEVLQNASVAGLLPAPTVAALLPTPVDVVVDDYVARSQIAKIKEMMASASAARESKSEEWARHERESTAERKQDIRQKMQDYADQISMKITP